jgi:hypothetical protein
MAHKPLSLAAFVLFPTLALACSLSLPPTKPAAAPEPAAESGGAQGQLPLIEADVPRVSLAEAKAAFDGGTAVFVDVRAPGAYQQSHIPAALSIQLGEIETDAAGLDLDKDRWIITYCT